MSEFEEEVAIEEEESSLNDDLAAAWEASEASIDDDIEQEAPVEAQAPEEAPVEAAAEVPEGVEAPPTDDKPAEDGAAPQSLSPEAREKWKDTPAEVKAEFKRMDQRIEGMAQKYGQSYQRTQQMDKALAPFSQYFQMNGGAGQTIQSLLQTGSMLQMGTPQQKAAMTAQIIKQFGIDINTLDSMLVGEAPAPEQQQQQQFEQMLNQKLQPLQQQLQTYQQREQYEQKVQQHQVGTEIQQFASKNEFYNDVRADMADLLDLAANRNRPMDMDEAYRIACSQHPTISKIIAARGSQETVNRKRQAASSIRGNPGGDSMSSGASSISAALNDAWDSVGRV